MTQCHAAQINQSENRNSYSVWNLDNNIVFITGNSQITNVTETLFFLIANFYLFFFDIQVFIVLSSLIFKLPCWYLLLVYTKTVDSVKRARWLARQTPNILHYLPPSNSGKMASRFASVASEEVIQN